MRLWFETHTLIKGKKKREHWLTWFCDRAVEDGPMVVASDMPLYMDMMELGPRVARVVDKQ